MNRSRAVFAIALLGNSLGALDLSALNVALPRIRETFAHSQPSEIAWVVAAYPIVFVGVLVAAGREADRLGRKWWFERGLVVFAVGSILSGLAPSVHVLIAGRVVQAVGAAVILPASLGAVLAVVPPARRSRTVTVWAASAFFATALGPLAGAAALGLGSWRTTFLAEVPLAVAILALSRSQVPESRSAEASARTDLAGVTLAVAAATAAALGIVKGREWGWTDEKVFAAAILAFTAGALLVWRSGRHPSPVLDLSLFRDRRFTVGACGITLFGSAYLAYVFSQVQFLAAGWHYSPIQSGLAFSVSAVTIALLAPWTGRAAEVVGHRALIVPGALVFALGMAWFRSASVGESSYVEDWLPASILGGVGIAMTMPVLNAAALSRVPSQRLSVASGVVQSGRSLGGVVGVALMFALLGTPSPDDVGASFARVWTYIALAAVGTSAVAALLPGRYQFSPAERATGEPVAVEGGGS